MGKIFFPQYIKGRKKGVLLAKGKSILTHIKELGGVEIDTEQGEDIVRIVKGSELLSPLSAYEKEMISNGRLKEGQRLASHAKIIDDTSDVVVFMSSFGKYTILTDIIERDTRPEPAVKRSGGRVIYENGKDMGPYIGRIYGAAVDIGTTTIVMQIIDLETGKNIYRPVAFKNPQITYGNDIISRIGYTIENPDGLREVQAAAIEGINESLARLEQDSGVEPGTIKDNIYDLVIVGNSTMREIFFGNNVKSLGLIPYEPENKGPILAGAKQLGLMINDNAMVYGAPLIGGHAGADCLADIIASRIYKSKKISMIVDIGTNGEVVIGNKEKMYSASCAAGGAYEGYQISCGVGAVEGAITAIRIDDGRIEYSTIGDKPPVGICGSGVIDLMAEMHKNRIMNSKTRIEKDYYLNEGVYITQDDINQLIIAKAGLRTDQDLLIKYFGVSLEDVDRIYLAGAFGNFMNIENAITIGLLPGADKSKFVRFGNGALAGAMDMLLSLRLRKDAENLKDIIQHKKPNEVEGKDFQYMIADNMYFS
jgi:uncharacterized 2Fe-2S/4Fe-4S cluster protein (DUF4445 family)